MNNLFKNKIYSVLSLFCFLFCIITSKANSPHAHSVKHNHPHGTRKRN